MSKPRYLVVERVQLAEGGPLLPRSIAAMVEFLKGMRSAEELKTDSPSTDGKVVKLETEPPTEPAS